MSYKRRVIGISVGLLALAGCAHVTPPNPKAAPVRSIQGSLDRSAKQVALAWTRLDEEQAAVHPPVVQSPSVLPADLARTVDFPWNGPLHPLVEKLAKFAGYKVRVRGPAPAAPIVVTLHGQHTVFNALQIVGEQTGKLADVRLNADQKVITIHYQSN